ncbi:MAG: restriction endonuclease subunit S [Firmicutes bacterium]|nr:restriction endonuclease subunit S [Bacillota bacterium]
MEEIKYRKEDEMKDSGIQWLGKIPKQWEEKKLRYISSIETGNKDTQDKVDDGIYPFFVRSDTVESINSYSYNGEAILTAGDGVGVGKVFHYIKGKFAFHQRVYKLSDFKKVKGKYLYYYVSENFHKEVLKLSAKSTVDSLRRPMFSNFIIAHPKELEQQKIANFLDIKTSQFDSIILKKEKLIEKLEEAKKSLISELVTGKVKIVDGEMVERKPEEMKDSGIEWLGMIPKDWKTTKIKNNTYVKGRIGWQGLRSDEFIDEGPYLVTGTDFENNNINWDRCYHVSEKRYKEAPSIHLKNGDLLITKDGSIGKLAIVENCPEKATLNSGIFVTRCTNNEYLTKYMFYLLSSKVFDTYIDIKSTGSTIQHLYQHTFVNFKYTIPYIKEQQVIVEFLNKKIEIIDLLITKTKTQIQKLKEAKQSLISEVVTGKIDLRDWEIREEDVV